MSSVRQSMTHAGEYVTMQSIVELELQSTILHDADTRSLSQQRMVSTILWCDDTNMLCDGYVLT